MCVCACARICVSPHSDPLCFVSTERVGTAGILWHANSALITPPISIAWRTIWCLFGNYSIPTYGLFPGDTVFIQGAAATPLELVKEMTDFGKSSGLKNVSVCHMHTEGVAGYTEPDCVGKCRCFICVDTVLHRVDDTVASAHSAVHNPAKRSSFCTLVSSLWSPSHVKFSKNLKSLQEVLG